MTTNVNGGSIVTGGGALTMTGNSVNANTSGSTASISGNFSLGGGTRTFTIATGVTMNIPANVSNGSIIKNSAGTLSLSGNNTFSGSLRLNTGTLILGTDTALGTGTLTLSAANTYNGGTTISGGTLIAASDAALGAASGVLTISGGILKAGGAIMAARGISIGASGGTIDTNGNTVLVSGAISGSTSLLKSGAGTLRISGALNVPATIGTGNVILSGATGTGAFTIQNDASLEGAGTVGGVTAESGGTLALGDATTGLLNIGDFNLKSAAHLSIELGGTTAGAASNGYDRVGVTGGITLGGDLQGSLIGGFRPTHGDLFFLIVNDGADAVTGPFAGLAQGSVVSFGGSSFAVTYTGDSAGNTITGGNDVALLAVPEPHPCAAILGGIFLLAARRRRGGSFPRS